MGRKCNACGKTLSLEEFAKRTSICKGCKCVYNRQRFGVSPAQYDAKLAEQGGGCATCGKTPEQNKQFLAIDHDHGCCPSKSKACGRCFRGLLCKPCNLALGQTGDSVETLLAMVKYLVKEDPLS